MADQPRIVVISTLFPSEAAPTAGVFIRERMFRVAKRFPVSVISPVPWFPLQFIIRWFVPGYRPPVSYHEKQDGIDVFHPRFFSVPGILRRFDGWFMGWGCRSCLQRIRQQQGVDLIDSHFAYPDGYAATWLGQREKLPVTITLRGTEVPLAKTERCSRMMAALERASRVFSVSQSLKEHVVKLGADERKIRVVGNGVDMDKFHSVDSVVERQKLGLGADIPVLISVGGLVERKGFHRVIKCLPDLLKQFPKLVFLVVGGASKEGDWSERLHAQVDELGLQEHVRFLGILPPAELKGPLSAADVFVLSTRNEGWANVFLEAMACGLPVISTDVGGNAEVVCQPSLGTIVPFDDQQAMTEALRVGLAQDWDRDAIIDFARDNSWDNRVDILQQEFQKLFHEASA